MDQITLSPHDPLPEGPDRRVVLLRRFDEDAPSGIHIELRLEGGQKGTEAVQPHDPSGLPMAWDAAIEAATKVAVTERLSRIYIVDRTAGPREQIVLQHGGDHSAEMEQLTDTDPEDGETGPDMRDRRP